MVMKTCVAHKVYKLRTDAPNDEAIIALAEQVSIADGHGILDSLDLGDSMGAFIQHLDKTEEVADGWPVDDIMIPGEGFTVTISSHWELFKWGDDETNPVPPGPFDYLTRQVVEDSLRDQFPESSDD